MPFVTAGQGAPLAGSRPARPSRGPAGCPAGLRRRPSAPTLMWAISSWLLRPPGCRPSSSSAAVLGGGGEGAAAPGRSSCWQVLRARSVGCCSCALAGLVSSSRAVQGTWGRQLSHGRAGATGHAAGAWWLLLVGSLALPGSMLCGRGRARVNAAGLGCMLCAARPPWGFYFLRRCPT